MIVMWLIMALMVVGGFLYLCLSMRTAVLGHGQTLDDDFIQLRKKEIDTELENGRISSQEAGVLLSDLQNEDTSADAYSVMGVYDLRFAKWVLLCFLAFVMLGSVSLYEYLGYSKDVAFTQMVAAKTNTPSDTLAFLKYRTQRFGRVGDWYDEAQALMVSSQFDKALVAYENVLKELPQESDDYTKVLVQYAQAIFYSNGNHSSAKMKQIVNQVLARDEHNSTALSLKGVAAFDEKDYLNAILAWQAAVRNNNDMAARQTLLGAINTARKDGAISYKQVPSLITRQVAIKLVWDKSKVTWQPGDILLIYAHAKGQKMPLAIRRVLPQDLDKTIVLTNLDSPMSKTSLEGVSKVDLVVKLSNVSSKDLTKGQVIGTKEDVPSNSKAIYTIKVTL